MNGMFFHIYNRGNNGEKIFFEERNYNYFLKKFSKYLLDFIDVYCNCLLPEHFHLIIRIKDIDNFNSELFRIPDDFCKQLSPVEKAFKDFFISYAKSINKAYERTGSLFQCKYKRNLISNEDELRRLIAYIHTNPIRRGYCSNIEDWNFSSYNFIIHLYKVSKIYTEVVDLFGGLDSFEKFHMDYMDHQRESDLLFKDYYKSTIPRLSKYITNYSLFFQLKK